MFSCTRGRTKAEPKKSKLQPVFLKKNKRAVKAGKEKTWVYHTKDGVILFDKKKKMEEAWQEFKDKHPRSFSMAKSYANKDLANKGHEELMEKLDGMSRGEMIRYSKRVGSFHKKTPVQALGSDSDSSEDARPAKKAKSKAAKKTVETHSYGTNLYKDFNDVQGKDLDSDSDSEDSSSVFVLEKKSNKDNTSDDDDNSVAEGQNSTTLASDNKKQKDSTEMNYTPYVSTKFCMGKPVIGTIQYNSEGLATHVDGQCLDNSNGIFYTLFTNVHMRHFATMNGMIAANKYFKKDPAVTARQTGHFSSEKVVKEDYTTFININAFPAEELAFDYSSNEIHALFTPDKLHTFLTKEGCDYAFDKMEQNPIFPAKKDMFYAIEQAEEAYKHYLSDGKKQEMIIMDLVAKKLNNSPTGAESASVSSTSHEEQNKPAAVTPMANMYVKNRTHNAEVADSKLALPVEYNVPDSVSNDASLASKSSISLSSIDMNAFAKKMTRNKIKMNIVVYEFKAPFPAPSAPNFAITFDLLDMSKQQDVPGHQKAFWLWKPTIFSCLSNFDGAMRLLGEALCNMEMVHKRKQPYKEDEYLMHPDKSDKTKSYRHEMAITYVKKDLAMSIENQVDAILQEFMVKTSDYNFQKLFSIATRHNNSGSLEQYLMPKGEGKTKADESLWHMLEVAMQNPSVQYKQHLTWNMAGQDIAGKILPSMFCTTNNHTLSHAFVKDFANGGE